MCGHGTNGHGLVMGLAESGQWLDLVILKVFPNLNDWFRYSIILEFLKTNMREGVDILYRCTHGESSGYKPQSRMETFAWDVSNCINKDLWKLYTVQQGVSDLYNT